MEFIKFNKIPRLNRECIVTEKIDGTNAQVYVEHGPIVQNYVVGPEAADLISARILFENDGLYIFAGSRKRYLTIETDNFGFARWVKDNGEELLKLGPGRHFGEWWGQGIQRNYGLTEKRFSLFNVHKWSCFYSRPECCHVVPVLYRGEFDTDLINHQVKHLFSNGSIAAPGFMNPEGIIVFHTAGGNLFKVTCENDEKHKGEI